MHYQISRNGQIYGPYTLEDLRRYLASGNVLLTDLAKSEEMSEWVPVSQILGGENVSGAAASSGFSAGFQNPSHSNPGVGATYVDPVYNPAADTGVAFTANQYPDPPNLNWGLYLLFTILTCGLFSKVFTVVQAAWLKKVQPNSNGLIFYIALYVLLIISYFRGFSIWASMMTHPGEFHHNSVGHSVLTLLYFILLFVTRFVMSASLEEHFNGPEPIGLRLNPVMVFLFGGIYFQYQFNRINQMKQAARYGVGRVF